MTIKTKKKLKHERPALDKKAALIAIIENIDTEKVYLRIEFTFRRKRKTVPVPGSTTPEELYKILRDRGAELDADRNKALSHLQEVLNSKPLKELEETWCRGWHGDTFVHPLWTEGSIHSLSLAEQVEPDAMFYQNGNAQQWKEGLEKPCRVSTFLPFTIGVALAGPIQKRIGSNRGVIFNFHGKSTKGKSLACRAAQSLFARANDSDLMTYDFTDRSLEELCYACNDLMLVLDEAGRSSGNDRQRAIQNRKLAYTFASGRGKTRAKAVKSHGLENLEWTTIGLTNGEYPLEDTAGAPRADGERIRHIDIPLPKTKRGIFDLLEQGSKEGKTYAKQVKETIRDHYNVALRPYICAIIKDWDAVPEKVNASIQCFSEDMGIRDDADPWDQEFAGKFGLIRAAMELAVEYDVAPWTVEQAHKAVRMMYLRARKAVATAHEQAEKLVLRIAKARTNKRRFPILEAGNKLPSRLRTVAHGFRRTHAEHGRIIAINPGWIAELCGPNAVQQAVMAHWVNAGLVIKDSDGKRHMKIAVKGFYRPDRARWLCISEDALIAVAEKIKTNRITSRSDQGSLSRRK